MEQTQAGKVPSSVQEVPGRGETFQVARERLNQTLSGVSETVHNNPWTSTGVGFGLGVIVGALVAWAASSRRIA
jgi:ElaB/YqjD/DUF883 family membrane-anchored ribosome-binding protein